MGVNDGPGEAVGVSVYKGVDVDLGVREAVTVAVGPGGLPVTVKRPVTIQVEPL